MTAERYLLGIDVGGTFTDLALIRVPDGVATYHKTASTPDDPARAIADGLTELLQRSGVAPSSVRYFAHGTTVATNALLTGEVAVTGLITTEGFRDILEIRRQRQPHNYDIRLAKPPPLVPRHLRRELRERTYLMALPGVAPELAALDAILADFRAAGVEAVAVCFLHSYHDPGHEARVAAAVRERFPEAFVCASHEVLAEFREYERITTTVLNASLGPIMSRYLERLEANARAIGVVPPAILQSHGGVASPRDAGRRAVRTLGSGPAAGVIGASFLAERAGLPDLISFDVGGTSTDVCLIEGARPLIAKEREFGGHPVRVPMIDVHSVGAGGGSIAWVDAGGFLHVGPQSAGAAPGPACYGRGGTQPTITDANVVLGRLPPDALLGGRMPIRAELARRAVRDAVAVPMGLGVEEAAQGILTILNESLVRAIRVISIERGFDPRRFTLVAFGGAGPLLASALARELGMRSIMVPANPGLLCALGLLVADVRCDFSLTRVGALDDGGEELEQVFAELERSAAQWFDEEGVERGERGLERTLDMRYVGQSHELTVAVPPGPVSGAGERGLAGAFRREHERVYGYAPEAAIERVTFRVAALARTAAPPLRASEPCDVEPGAALEAAPPTGRPVYFPEWGGFRDCPVYERGRLPVEGLVEGPAIVEQMDSTTVVLPGQSARAERDGRLTLTFDRG